MAINFETVKNFFLGSSLQTLAGNFNKVAEEFERVVRRDGSTPMEADLDLNGQRIINHGYPKNDNDLATLAQVREAAKLIATGPAGPSNNTRISLAALKAANITDKTSLYDNALWTWTPGDFSATLPGDLDVLVVQSTGIPLSVGAWIRQRNDSVYLRTFGADPTGSRSSVAAINAALASGKRVLGMPGDNYLVDQAVFVPEGRELIGNGATLTMASGILGLRLQNDKCKISGWTLVSKTATYCVLDQGRFTEFSDNICQGNVGHFYFSTGASDSTIARNRIEGLTASTEITAAVAIEAGVRVKVVDNDFNNIPQGWGVHVRERPADGAISRSVLVANNQFYHIKMRDSVVATNGQKVFSFKLPYRTLLDITKNEPKVRIQVNGKPVSPVRPDGTVVYRVEKTANTNDYTITFTNGQQLGDSIALIGYRGAENIQINGGTEYYVVTGNLVDGTADTGIICLGPYGIVSNNNVRNCGYTGIAVYGNINFLLIANNTVADCAQMDDGFSSPDDYRVPSVFAGAVFCGGENAIFSNNLIINNSNTMRYGFYSNKFATPRTDGSAALTYRGNSFIGSFPDGRYYFPNQSLGLRMNSIDVDGATVDYPQQIDLEGLWVEQSPGSAAEGKQVPASTRYWDVGGSSGTRCVRNTTMTHDGGVAIQTVAGEFVEFSATRAAKFRDCIVTVQFWAKNIGGSSYFHVITGLGGPEAAIVVPITEMNWKLYTVRFPLSNDLDNKIRLRIGGNIGSASVQDIQIYGNRT